MAVINAQSSSRDVARRKAWARRKHAVVKIVAYALTTILAVLFSTPFLWMLSSSLKSKQELAHIPPTLLPNQFLISNYVDAWNAQPFDKFFINTAVYTGLATIGLVISCSLVAYAFARLEFPGRNALFLLVLSSVMMPSQVTLIPQYILFRELGWLDTLRPLIVPAFFGSALYIFLMRQFFLGIPRELDESALIDGANRWQIYVKVILPLSKPIIVTIVAFSFVSHWNDFLGPLIYLNRPESMTLAVGLLLFKGDVDTLYHLLMAAAVFVVSPVVIVFFFAQRYFVTSITMTGLREG